MVSMEPHDISPTTTQEEFPLTSLERIDPFGHFPGCDLGTSRADIWPENR